MVARPFEKHSLKRPSQADPEQQGGHRKEAQQGRPKDRSRGGVAIRFELVSQESRVDGGRGGGADEQHRSDFGLESEQHDQEQGTGRSPDQADS